MKNSILLNWLPFENTATGAAKRALELHSRISGEISMKAVVTSGFPSDAASSVDRAVAAPSRSLRIRLSERSPAFWKKAGSFDVWVTDTLPVPRFGTGVKVVLTVHDLRFLENWRYLSLPRYLLLRFTMAEALRRADAIVTVSSWIARQIRDHYSVPSGKLSVIPNAAATFPDAVGKPLLQVPYLLTVGHLEPRKDQSTLIRAFAAMAGSWPGNLVIAGGGAMKADLRSLAEGLGISSRVVFTGRISDGELASLYRRCCVLVCPSLYEGFGMTVLEGLEAGVPVAASSIPSHVEVAGDSASWFTPGDSRELTSVLLEILGDSGSFSPEAGFSRAALFSWDESALKLTELYRKLQGSTLRRG